MLSEKSLQNKVKDGIKNLWGRITDEEIEKASGNLYRLSSIVEERYGETKQEINNKIDKLLASLDNKTDQEKWPSTDSFERSPLTDGDSHRKTFH